MTRYIVFELDTDDDDYAVEVCSTDDLRSAEEYAYDMSRRTAYEYHVYAYDYKANDIAEFACRFINGKQEW